MSGKKTVHSIPDAAVPVREVGPWTIYVSKAERAFYIRLSDGAAEPLKLSLEEILQLVRSMGVRSPSGKTAAAAWGQNKEPDFPETEKHKRRFKRFTRRCEAEFTAGDVRLRGIASDFSLNGLFLKTNYPASPDTAISLAVHLPDGSTAYLKGKVKRSMKTAIGKVTGMPMKSLKNGMGVELTEKDTAYLNFIRSLIHE
ncbi:MAG: PilZ domain-containing protein [Nitrospiraceae bacterium]|nr:PilZ domain-containing protein [Nitrospiraceae bacterium]